MRHLLESIWDESQVPIIKNSRKKPETKSVSKNEEKSEKKSEKEKKTGACVQVSNLGKGVNKKMIVHDIFKGYKITNYGLYIETENSICTGKVRGKNFKKFSKKVKKIFRKIFKKNFKKKFKKNFEKNSKKNFKKKLKFL